MTNQNSRRPLSARTEPVECQNVPPITPKNQILQFDHPDASPYVFTSNLNSQNCISARRIHCQAKQQNNQPVSHKITKQASISSFPVKSNSLKINENSSTNVERNEIYNKYAVKIFETKAYRRPKHVTPTFHSHEYLLNRKLPDEKELQSIKKELDALKPPAIIWDDTTNIPMNICVTESCENFKKTENQGRKNSLDKKKQVSFIGPSQTILNGKIIVDNEPININQKPEAAPLISSKAFCQDYFGVLNSLSSFH